MENETNQELTNMVRSAVSSGIKDALHDRAALDQFWNSAFAQLQGRATKETGRFVLSGLRGIVSKTLMFLILGMAVYGLGGWAAVHKVWHAIWSTQ